MTHLEKMTTIENYRMLRSYGESTKKKKKKLNKNNNKQNLVKGKLQEIIYFI